jgi:hydrogenase maturation protein HypF
VRNQPGGVRIEVEGEGGAIDHFLADLIRNPPPLANIVDCSWQPKPPVGDREFHIDASDHLSAGQVVITPDAGTCDACLAEIFDPSQRRYRYAFTNCTHCGPRLTIVMGAPYDRATTTMAGFEMCADCRREYDDPADRRFHAQPIACAKCGPRLTLRDSRGVKVECADPLADFATAICAGKIGAMKGLGGYHLVCDAQNEAVVEELRRRKHRYEKPLAIMVRDVAAAEALCEMDAISRELLVSSRRPIVLMLKRRKKSTGRMPVPLEGVMLPYTPLHHLLLAEVDGPLVMTSGNRSDEPIAYVDDDAIERLGGIADIFLTHDRPIHVRCDDSVTRVIDGVEAPIRRSRGYAPQPIALPMECPAPILATGGQMKGTFALAAGKRAIVSHHLGDLDNFEAFTAFEKDIALYEKLFSHRPACIAHDLHPDYASTRYAIARAGRETGVKLIGVQHHHAHMASCMAEHQLTGPVIGVTFDGTGFGTDGAIWGGEFLLGDYQDFQRAAHLRYVGLPGGEQAVREPWRMAAAYLIDAGATCASFESRVPASSRNIVRQMLDRNFNSPMTSSAGRLFDAVASLIGVRDRVSYEGQAAIELEWMAMDAAPAGSYPFALEENDADATKRGTGGPPVSLPSEHRRAAARLSSPKSDATLIIDTRPLIRAIADDLAGGVSPPIIARKFHSTLVEIIAEVCAKIAEPDDVRDVVLSGGVFMNALLSSEVAARLSRDNFRVYRHKTVPANDGGLSLGQAAVAASRLLLLN